MTFTISKSKITYIIAIAILAISLSVGFLAYKVGAQEPAEVFEDATVTSDNELNLGGIEVFESNIPHLSCTAQLSNTELPASDTYSTDTIYTPTFMRDGPSLQDINGDSLPDYMFVDHEMLSSGEQIHATFEGCVYLNNGQGWDQVYLCFARTRSERPNGNIIQAEYRGDCADTSSAQQGS